MVCGFIHRPSPLWINEGYDMAIKGQYTKAMGALLAINTQVAGVIWGAFSLEEYLSERNFISEAGRYLLWFVALAVCVHSYYAMVRYLQRLDKQVRLDRRDP